MNMTFTFTLWDLGYFVIGILVIILLLYLISCVKNVLPLLKKANMIMEHTATVTEITAAKTQEVDGAISHIIEAVVMFADIIKGNQSKASAATNVVNSFVSLKNIFGEKDTVKKKKKK